MELVESPPYRMSGETTGQCMRRKVPEILKENPGMDEKQAIAIAHSTCAKTAAQKELREHRILEADLRSGTPPWAWATQAGVPIPVELGISLNEFIEDIMLWRNTELVAYEGKVAREVERLWARGTKDMISRMVAEGDALTMASQRQIARMMTMGLTALTNQTLAEVETALVATGRHQQLIAQEIADAFTSFKEMGGAFSQIPTYQVPPYQALGSAMALNATDPNWFMRGLFTDPLIGETGNRAANQILTAFVQGQDVFALARTLERTFGRAKGWGETLARTSIHRISSMYRSELHAKNKDVLKKEMFSATLDSTTCPVCGNYDGKRYDIGTGPMIPAHDNCRCVYIPITKSLRELVGMKPDPREDPMARRTRRSFDGPVAATQTWAQWVKRKNNAQPGFAKKILGASRYKAWTDGEITLKGLTRGGRIRTIKNLGIPRL